MFTFRPDRRVKESRSVTFWLHNPGLRRKQWQKTIRNREIETRDQAGMALHRMAQLQRFIDGAEE
jgi:hypothetical protein